jgi:hypothetical protein
LQNSENNTKKTRKMTVKELIKLLKKEDPSALVIMSKDGEGNSYSPLSSFWSGGYLADTTWSGEAGLLELTEVDEVEGYTEEDVLEEGAVKAIIFCPVN